MREWLSGGVSPCQGEGRGFESRLALFKRSEVLISFFVPASLALVVASPQSGLVRIPSRALLKETEIVINSGFRYFFVLCQVDDSLLAINLAFFSGWIRPSSFMVGHMTYHFQAYFLQTLFCLKNRRS